MQQILKTRVVIAGGLFLAGILHILFAEEFAVRAYLQDDNLRDNLFLIYAFGTALLGGGFAVLTEPAQEDAPRRSWTVLFIALAAVVYFLLLAQHLHSWWIDDAGITFSYSRSLSEGLGLVAQPWLSPEEGYSSTIWMLLLSGAARFGADIPSAAKVLGLGSSALCIVICMWIIAREGRGPLAALICGIGIAGAPTVVWAASGQEHALQALLLMLCVLCVYHLQNWRWPVAVVLSVFVLTRPEAPIIVICVFLTAVWLTRRRAAPFVNAADIAVALLPFVTFLALLGFRLLYFGDLLPNPFYAKSESAGFLGVFNLLGGGWAYILSGVRDTALLIVLPLLLLIRMKPLPEWLAVATAILVGHVIFVIWAKGDWMGQYRFLMPVMPIFMLLAALGVRRLSAFRLRAAFTLVAVLILMQTTISQLSVFKAGPTTPLAAVEDVGEGFRRLAEQLEIDDPLLAHHDAGAIAYYRMIRLVDLGGLIDRQIAQNMTDTAFLTTYLLEDLRPDFFFGARNFAMASGLAETMAFNTDYVRLDFPDRPYMQSEMAYIRRDRVRAGDGIETLRDDTGALEKVLVYTCSQAGGTRWPDC